ncbi:amidohydrolase [Peribacillus alkalitolerans]|uniref:amidohydrolase n=1 Tax=Peribacillus alkalitolerans TaxID=1550385 RepID=UPI0013D1EA54|nr:amidohydrolase [Peribacillus alkalitolerans]
MNTFWIKNILIETGFVEEEGQVIRTKTELAHLKVEGGVIVEVAQMEPNDGINSVDGEGKLVMPSLRDMHIHIDKTYYGGPWKAVKPAPKGVQSRIEEEQTILPQQLPFVQERAEKMIELLLRNGHTHIRTHCNVDPVIGLKNLEATVHALEKYKDSLSYEIVAFPQHGLLRSDSIQLVRDAMKNGATLVGGVDPATIDRNIEKSLYTIFDIAVESGKGVDIHLHDPNSLGAFTFERMAHNTKEAGLIGKATISHGSALADLEPEALKEMVSLLTDLDIDVTTTVPITRTTIPIPTLDRLGMRVSLGHDSITDHWSPFGTGNTMNKMSLLAERFRQMDEKSLASIVKYGNGGITLLNEQGERNWPKVGDEASMILVDASCSAEAVARRAEVSSVYYKGKKVESKLSERMPIS